MKLLLFIFQKFLKLSLIFFIFFIWLKFITKSLWLSIFISTIAAIIIEIISYIFTNKNRSKQTLKIKEKEAAENIFLSLSTSHSYLDFFLQLALSRHSSSIKKKDYIQINHRDKTKVLLYPFLQLKKFSLNDLLTLTTNLGKEKIDKLVITCFEYEKEVIPFIRNFEYEILVLDRFDTYSHLYKEYDFYPEITMTYKKEGKLTIKDLIAFSFNKSRTKGYIFASLLLFATSFFVKLNIYYCIVSSILLLFALISYINPKYNNSLKKEII